MGMRILAAVAALFLAVAPGYAEVGADGLHDAPWIRETSMDLAADLAAANAEGKRLMLIFEQRGCLYCTRMHEKVFSRPKIARYLNENYYVVQINFKGDKPVTDFDGDRRSERQISRKWGILLTPTILFVDTQVPAGGTLSQGVVAVIPGAVSAKQTLDMLEWVRREGYKGG
ncbi:thioredoxin family protein [Tropicimonas sp. TH_r6]|uniref:thioredoxin family protein n=1 Tax=Tropicimonas sp. TH_r6 TaxID=3082085 RepID=UPI0029551DAC|nr:thioredoxin family protein [Tropicimonas sp. TH_r6]MDV7142929.1 thioredoxin family protein [Tropicimonas sp. TH_r6]